jgi:hypothetical protein
MSVDTKDSNVLHVSWLFEIVMIFITELEYVVLHSKAWQLCLHFAYLLLLWEIAASSPLIFT